MLRKGTARSRAPPAFPQVCGPRRDGIRQLLSRTFAKCSVRSGRSFGQRRGRTLQRRSGDWHRCGGGYGLYCQPRRNGSIDGIKKEIDAHFLTLAREARKDVLVVRGLDATAFRQSVYEAPAFFDETWRKRAKFPSLIVTNRVPSEAVSDANALEKGKVIIFPLADIYREHKSIAGFLTELVDALSQEDAMGALEDLDGNKLQKGWSWLGKYFKLEPGFFGFNLKLNSAIKDLLAGSRT
jgi:hypothetical protein